MMISDKMAETEVALDVAKKMCAAARTAPKTRGRDSIVTAILTERDSEHLADEMEALSRDKGEQFAKRNQRDSRSVRKADAIVLLGTRSKPRGVSFCGFCGFHNCGEAKQKGGHCAFDDIDLGIALGSAVSVAADHRVDNRIMFSIGRTAMEMNLLGHDVTKILGISLSISGKNKFFDLGNFHPDHTV